MYNVLLWINMNGWVSVPGRQGLTLNYVTITGLQPSSTYKAQVQAYLPGTRRTALSNTVSNINTQRSPKTKSTTTNYTPVVWLDPSTGYDSGLGPSSWVDPETTIIGASGGFDEGEQ